MSAPRDNPRQFGLIKTKFNAPRMAKTVIKRHGLLGEMATAKSSVNVIPITGAAGSGKSILMGQLHERVKADQHPSCWLTLEKEDDDVSAFISYFTAALNQLDTRLGERAFQINNTQFLKDPSLIFQSIAEDISTVDKAGYIFLDDFQNLSQPDIILGLDRVVSALPACVKLVIASRVEPRLSLSKKRIDGTLMEISQSGLNLSMTEIDEMLGQDTAYSLSPKDLNRLHQSTEGWAAGVQMVELAIQRDPNNAAGLIRDFSGKDKALGRYLMESVFNAQDEKTQHFLTTTAALSRMNKDVCRQLTGYDDAGEILDHIYKKNLFLIPLDSHGNWYRYHHLFSEFLVQNLKTTAPHRWEDICQMASEWFQKNGYYTEAIQYLLSAGRYAEGAKLIAMHGAEAAQKLGDHRTILDWMRRLPPEHHDDHPLILLNYAWSLIFTRSSHLGRQTAEQVIEELERRGDEKWDMPESEAQDIKCLADVVIAISYASEDNSEMAQSLAETALQKWPHGSASHRGALYNSLAYSCIANLHFDEGLEAASKARALGLKAKAEYVIVWADWISAILCLKKGRLGQAEDYLLHGRDSLSRLTGPHSYSDNLLTVLQAEIYLDQGETDKAAQCLDRLSGFSASVNSMEPLLILQRSKARSLYKAQGYQAAINHLHFAEEQGLASETPRIAIFLAAEEIKIHIHHGNFNDAKAAATRWGFLDKKSVFDVTFRRRISYRLRRYIQLRLYVMDKKFGQAYGLIPKLISQAKASQRGRFLIELMLLKSICLWELDRQAEAMRSFSEILHLAAAENFIAPFIDNQVTVKRILQHILNRRAEAANTQPDEVLSFERALMQRLNGDKTINETNSASQDKPNVLIDEMSPREIEILHLLAKGMTNKELADSLILSISTVKWHLNNIFGKLDVRNRTASVNKARQLNII